MVVEEAESLRLGTILRLVHCSERHIHRRHFSACSTKFCGTPPLILRILHYFVHDPITLSLYNIVSTKSHWSENDHTAVVTVQCQQAMRCLTLFSMARFCFRALATFKPRRLLDVTSLRSWARLTNLFLNPVRRRSLGCPFPLARTHMTRV